MYLVTFHPWITSQCHFDPAGLISAKTPSGLLFMFLSSCCSLVLLASSSPVAPGQWYPQRRVRCSGSGWSQRQRQQQEQQEQLRVLVRVQPHLALRPAVEEAFIHTNWIKTDIWDYSSHIPSLCLGRRSEKNQVSEKKEWVGVVLARSVVSHWPD